MALSKSERKKLGIIDPRPHNLTVGDKFYLYGTEIAEVLAIEGDSWTGVTYAWNGNTYTGLPAGKHDTVWEKVTA